MRYFIRLSYRGTPFHGWQRQPNALSVQQVVEESLSTVLRTPTVVTGAGRTDAGVNARCMYAHFDTPEEISDVSGLLRGLNRLCGKDIALHEIVRVRDDAHARFDAISRQYRYVVCDEKSPFLYPLSWQASSQLDYDAMNRTAELLLRTSDFTSFAKLHSDAKTNICKVTRAEWIHPSEGMHVFIIEADRFLRNMVRAVVGTLVDVGRGKLSTDDVHHIIEAKNRCAAGTSMPGEALYLWDITYPDDIFNP